MGIRRLFVVTVYWTDASTIEDNGTSVIKAPLQVSVPWAMNQHLVYFYLTLTNKYRHVTSL